MVKGGQGSAGVKGMKINNGLIELKKRKPMIRHNRFSNKDFEDDNLHESPRVYTRGIINSPPSFAFRKTTGGITQHSSMDSRPWNSAKRVNMGFRLNKNIGKGRRGGD